MGLNKVFMMGRLVKEPDFKYTTSNKPLCNFTIAVNRPYKKEAEQTADFFNCVTWNNTAEVVSKYYHKGTMAIIEGRLQNNMYKAENGETRNFLHILVSNIEYGESKAQRDKQAKKNSYSDEFSAFAEFSDIPETDGGGDDGGGLPF